MSKDESNVDGARAGALAVETDRLRFSFLRDGVDKADMKEKTRWRAMMPEGACNRQARIE